MYRHYNDLRDYDRYFDNYYSKGLRRWENVFPNLIDFITVVKYYYLDPFYDLEEEQFDVILRQIYIRLDSKHRGQLFRYKNYARIIEKLNELILTPLINQYMQLLKYDLLITELDESTFKSVSRSYSTDNTTNNEIQQQFMDGASETKDFDSNKMIYYLKQRTTFLNTINNIYKNSHKLFMLYTDKKIETGPINYEQ